MAIRSRSNATSAASTSHSITLPAGVVAGDRLVVAFVNDDGTATASTSSTGWSSLATLAQGSNHRLTVFTKTATGSDALTVALSSSGFAAYCAAAQVGDGGTPTVQTSSGASATTGTVTSITGLTSGDYDSIVALGLDNSVGSTHTVTPSTGWGNLTTAGASGDPVLAAITDEISNGVTSISPGNVTWTNAEQWVTANIALPIPVGASGGTVPAFGSAGAHAVGTTSSSIAVAVPTGVQAGDIILVFLYKENTNAVTPPAGFTEIGTAPSTTGSVQAHHAFWKRATGADTGTYSFSWTGSVFRDAIATRWTGCIASGTPYDTGAGAPNSAARSTNGTTTPAVSLTTQGPNRMIVWSGSDFLGGPWTIPSGYTPAETDQALETSGTAYQLQPAAGATGSITGTGASSTQTAWLLALIPPSSAPPGPLKRQRRAFAIAPRRGEFWPVPVPADPNTPLVADGATATDAYAIVDSVTVTDTATATDAFTFFDNQPASTSDTATASDVFDVLDVYASTVLAPQQPPVAYEALVVARIPSAAAPPSFLIVDPIQWRSIEWTTALSAPQTLDLTCNISTLTEPVLQRFRRPAALATELWLLRNGQIVFAGPLATGQRDGEQLRLHADGLLAYLARMIVWSDLVFAGADQALIVKALVDHWQGRPYGHFGIDTSTVGAVGVTRDATYLKTELHPILQRVQELGKRINGFDVDVDPQSRQLQIWYPQRGTDRSSGEDAIVFDARNITSASTMFSVAPGDVASVAFGTGTSSDTTAGTLYGTATNAELLAQFGAAGVSSTWDSVKEQATLDGHVQGLLDARGEALFVPGPNVRVTPDADRSSYDAGDTVHMDVDDQLGVTGAFRLRTLKVSVSSSGQELVSPQFV